MRDISQYTPTPVRTYVGAFCHSLMSISRLATSAFDRDLSRQLFLYCQVVVDLFNAGWDDSRFRSGASHLCHL